MSPSQAISHFGTQVRLARALGICQSSVAEWVARGRIPYLRQFQIQYVTNGELAADPPAAQSADAHVEHEAVNE